MELKTLETISIDQILKVFNHSFSDYLIPFHLELDQLKSKLESENIKLEYSVGAFEKEQLVGFILHGYNPNRLAIYNGGTGVIPAYRGNGLTKQMYAFILPKLKQHNIKQLVLEVISNNTPAIKSYEKIGYQKVRELNCYKGTVESKDVNQTIEIKKLDQFKWDQMKSFWDIEPAWQYSIDTMIRSESSYQTVGAFSKTELIGYAIVNPKSGRISQIAVSKAHRRKKVGTSLVYYMATQFENKLSMINVDSSSTLNDLLIHLGFSHTLTQHEMKMDLQETN